MPPTSQILDRRTHTSTDPAPWWIKELRPYGLAGLLLTASCWYVYVNDGNQKDAIKAKDIVILEQTDKMISAYNGNSQATLEQSKSTWQLTSAVDELRKEIQNNK